MQGNVRLMKSVVISGSGLLLREFLRQRSSPGGDHPRVPLRCDGNPGCFDCLVRCHLRCLSTKADGVGSGDPVGLPWLLTHPWGPLAVCTDVLLAGWAAEAMVDFSVRAFGASSSSLWDLESQIKCTIYFHLQRGLWSSPWLSSLLTQPKRPFQGSGQSWVD